jgi:PAS domain S-box-containing protein
MASYSESGDPHAPTHILKPILIAGFVAIFVVLVAARIAGTINLRRVFDTSQAVAHSYSVKADLRQLLTTLINAETGGRGFIITGQVGYLERYDHTGTAIKSEIAEVRMLTAENREQQLDLDQLSILAGVKLDELAYAIQQRRESGFAAAQALISTNLGKHTMDNIRAIISRMEAREDALLALQTTRASQSYRFALILEFTITGLALIVVIALLVGTRRMGKDRLRAAQTAERFRVTLACIGDGMIATDASGAVSFINPVAETLTAWKQKEAIGRHIKEVFHIVNEQTREQVENPALRAIREGTVVGLANHTVLIAKDGTEIPVDDSGSPLMDAKGKTFGSVLIFRDITQRRKADKQRDLLAEQALILNSGFDGIIVRDIRDRIMSWNRVAEKLYGWTEKEVLGQVTHSLFKTVFPKPFGEIMQELHRNNRWQGELVRRRKDGSPIIVLSHWILDHDIQGQPRSILEINMDISTRKRAEERLHEQREWLRITLLSIGDAVIATDRDGAVAFLNPVARTLTGWKEEDALGRPIQEIFHIINEQTREPVENPALRAIREGIIVGLANHTVLVARDGTERPIDDSGSPIRDSEGKTVGAVLIFRDVTESKQAEERFRLAVQGAPTAMIMADPQGTIVLANALAEQLLGYGGDEMLGMPIDELVPARFRSHHVDFRTSYLASASQRPMGAGRSLYAVRKDGAEVPVEIGLSPIHTPDGTFIISAVTDITVRKRAAEAESRALRAAEDANRAKDQFLATVSHERRNPLNAILGWAVILKQGQSPVERTIRAFDVIERNARIEARLVDSLLDFSAIVAGGLKLNTERVDLLTITRTVVDSVQPIADAKDLKVALAVGLEPMVIIGDSSRLQQVFSNLLTNAIKFTPHGGHVQVHLSRFASRVQIQVIDDGEGIDDDFLPYIFDRFRQEQTTKARIHGGLGLGLAIVRELVQAHRGTVNAYSKGKGQGSTFTVLLPIPAVIPAHIEARTMQTPDAEESLISGLRVLVVDDDSDARELVAAALESRGVAVQSASSSSEALNSISQEPDVMIADIGMPQEDGYELIKKLRTVERERSRKRLFVIALSAYASVADRDDALAAGYDLYLTKPVSLRDLVHAVAVFYKSTNATA